MPAGSSRRHAFDRGFTLVEVLVSLALSLLVALAAMAMLLSARQGYSGLDAASQLRDNARFAADLITRIVMQAGYEDVANPGKVTKRSDILSGQPDPDPDIEGYDNAVIGPATTNPLNTTNGSRTTKCTVNDTTCRNGSDILVVRFSGSGTPEADGSMIDCFGTAVSEPVADTSMRSISVFHVTPAKDDGEPQLSCSRRAKGGGTWASPTPLIRGVESFQVLYGVSGVTPNAQSGTASMDAAKSAPTRYLRADQMVVSGDDAATRQNWRQVVSVRIGMVLRGPPGSAADRTASGKALAPLGDEAVGSGDVGNNDSGNSLSPAADGRLRQTVTFTVNLPNWLTLPPTP